MKTSTLFTAAIISSFLISGCSEEPKWKTMYNECKANVHKSLKEMKNDEDTKAMGDMAQSMGMAACEMIKSTCENNQEGFACQAIVGADKKEG
ncbi:MAG: hypothetical protein GY694_22620 [Gammaproteobacteria bacterium]|nr:hypothetical protein [Gammaproteobacteria bacterium]